MRVLLNSTTEELSTLGGDFTLYRDWGRLQEEELQFNFVRTGATRRQNAYLRKGFEKLCKTWQPNSLRQRLLLWSRFLYIPQTDLEGIAVIFSHLLFPLLTKDRVPIVWSSQGISPAVYYERYNRGQWTVEDVAFIYHELGKRSDALVIATELCARNVLHWCPELAKKVHVVPAPVFTSCQYLPTKPSCTDGLVRLLFVGVDAYRKGLPEVVEAYENLCERYSNICIDIVSRPADQLKEKIAHLRGATLHPSSKAVDIGSLMARADIFVLPTRADTYALAAVEAMAYGCAIVLSDLEPLPEIAPANEVGLIVPPGNATILAEKLDTMLASEEKLRQFQRCARQRYLNYHAPEVVAKQLKVVFRPLVESQL